jgi:hypothetical protein
MAEAKKRGVKFGRKPKLTDEQKQELLAEFRKGVEKVDLRKKY